MTKSAKMTKSANTKIGFWCYLILVFVTILNDKLSYYNILLSFTYIPLCLYFTTKVIFNYRYTIYLFYFSFLYIIYAILSPDVQGSLNSKWGMLNWELKVMLSFFPAFYYSQMGVVSSERLRKIGILTLVVAICSYFLNISMVLLNTDVDENGITNNVGYLFVCSLPLLFVNIKKNVILIIIAYIFVLASLKRGAILCAAVTLPYFIKSLNNNIKINKVLLFFIIAVIGFIGYHYIEKEISENPYVAKRVEQTLAGDSSGRDGIASRTWNEIEKFNIEDIVFGKGINYSMKINGNYVHNDWLELMTSCGILGCFFYLLTFWGMYKCCKRYCMKEYRMIGYLIVFVALIRSLVSMNYFSLDSIPLYYTLGLIFNRNLLCQK